MNTHRFATVLVALLVLLAGCAGGSGTLTDAPSGSDSDGTASGDQATQTGTLNFYVSDEQNAIADFEHLNVTIKRVTLMQANSDSDGDSEDADAEADAEAESEAEAEAQGESDEESGEDANTTANDSSTMTATGTAVVTANGSANASADAEADIDAEAEAEAEDDEAEDDEAADDDAGDGGKVTYEVDNVTVDLTQLQGDKASLVGSYDVPEGNYTKVFVHVGEVNGTLKTGEQVNVKLPSEKLHLNSNFEVGNGEDVDFVFDITAFKAGKSGKYILKPVISESGTSVPIEDVGADAAESEGERESEGKSSDEALTASFDGNVTVGENATLVVSQNGTPVESATVSVNGKDVGTTDADGELVVSIPDADEVTVEVTDGDAEAELEYEFGEDDEKKPDNPGKSGDTDA
ncbi:DUF4382 domain-containing protein [Haloferax larsenii]|uniref:DUF4382 domain-containing protein n=1 Tax=Haloferax larsenii TaxID=302484 RepID=A0A1H7HTR0_HALLR|nr:DUF4382 domain-containing protein [Haloferax larsenii]SEK52952.1 protein of unknown function [Haloferax larsenii]